MHHDCMKIVFRRILVVVAVKLLRLDSSYGSDIFIQLCTPPKKIVDIPVGSFDVRTQCMKFYKFGRNITQ